MNPSHNSHTLCQVAPADTQAKTWQRVCLFQRTTDRQSIRNKEGQGVGKLPQKQYGLKVDKSEYI